MVIPRSASVGGSGDDLIGFRICNAIATAGFNLRLGEDVLKVQNQFAKQTFISAHEMQRGPSKTTMRYYADSDAASHPQILRQQCADL